MKKTNFYCDICEEEIEFSNYGDKLHTLEISLSTERKNAEDKYSYGKKIHICPKCLSNSINVSNITEDMMRIKVSTKN
jgi:Zn finger protein HypA/HybF involved in hydrogenase expression